MKSQKFFSVKVNHFGDMGVKLGRNLLESVLQHLFNTDLKGKELANELNNRKVHEVDLMRLTQVWDLESAKLDWWKDNAFAMLQVR